MDSFLKSLIPSTSQDHVGWEDAPFLARLTGSYTPGSGNQANQNQYAFIEQATDPLTGFPLDLVGGRQTIPQAGPFTASYAVEANNTALTIPTTTPSGYANPGPYVYCKLKSYVGGAPVYEFLYEPTTLATSVVGDTGTTLSTSWTNSHLTLNLPTNSKWFLAATINGSITSSASGAGDSLSFRFNDSLNGAGAAIECCNVLCTSTTYIDACTLFYICTVNSVAITVTVQGIINTSSGSTGLLLGNSTLHGNYLGAIRLA